MSSGKAFGWVTVGNIHLPFIFRLCQKYVAVKIVQQEMVKKFTGLLPPYVFTCTNIKSHYITKREAKLWNEINGHHCGFQFGEEDFTTKDLIVSLADVIQFYDFLKLCQEKLSSSPSSDYTLKKDCGLLKVNETIIPYVQTEVSKIVPACMLPENVLHSATTEGTQWDVAYMRFLCQVAGLDKTKVKLDTTFVAVDKLSTTSPESGIVIAEWWPETIPLVRKPASSHHAPSDTNVTNKVTVIDSKTTPKTREAIGKTKQISFSELSDNFSIQRHTYHIVPGSEGTLPSLTASCRVKEVLKDGFCLKDHCGKLIPNHTLLYGGLTAVPACGYFVRPAASETGQPSTCESLVKSSSEQGNENEISTATLTEKIESHITVQASSKEDTSCSLDERTDRTSEVIRLKTDATNKNFTPTNIPSTNMPVVPKGILTATEMNTLCSNSKHPVELITPLPIQSQTLNMDNTQNQTSVEKCSGGYVDSESIKDDSLILSETTGFFVTNIDYSIREVNVHGKPVLAVNMDSSPEPVLVTSLTEVVNNFETGTVTSCESVLQNVLKVQMYPCSSPGCRMISHL
ncbi:uncharacterized protein LOC106468740 isoform X2 [Limulus polyphemus]|uniref:Uncharacterized protein LOC106468740 isoform X2 n=1 Tax=Limulus polyphemus TaxID=6850 RepID=A0ABM1TAA3_LIMPO|nr:uncharacterized protein LOC106468740 isoform X2 [Limulus polyphemus]